jgi:hypothetical protein
MVKDKMKNPLFVSNMRQEIVSHVYSNLQYESKFNLSNLEGEDALVMAIDNLINV